MIGILAWLLFNANGLPGQIGLLEGGAGSGHSEVESTPRSQWRKGVVPELYQIDADWKNLRYGEGTIGTDGCGPTCLSMVYVALTGKTDMGPASMAAFSERSGYSCSAGTSWNLMSEGASTIGLRSKELPADKTTVTNELQSGHPVICIMNPGEFTNTGHFIVLAEALGSGKVAIVDPNSHERTHKDWDVERILKQCGNLWAFSYK